MESNKYGLRPEEIIRKGKNIFINLRIVKKDMTK